MISRKCGDYDVESPNLAAFEILYPQFANDPRIQILIDFGKKELPFKCLCSVWDSAVYLYVAHKLHLFKMQDMGTSGSGGTSGIDQIVKKHTVADVSTEFERVKPDFYATSKDGYGTTPFGIELQTLIKSKVSTGVLNTAMVGM